jgi:hypothetical protein
MVKAAASHHLDFTLFRLNFGVNPTALKSPLRVPAYPSIEEFFLVSSLC